MSSTAKSEIVSKNELSDLELFAQKEIEKVDNLAPKESFVPFNNLKTTKVDEDLRKQIGTAPSSTKLSTPRSKIKFVPKHKTPSIPLPNVYVCETKQLSLAESLKLQQVRDGNNTFGNRKNYLNLSCLTLILAPNIETAKAWSCSSFG